MVPRRCCIGALRCCLPDVSHPETRLIATEDTPRLTQGPLGLAALVRMLVEPVVAIGTLAASALALGVPFEGPYVILALLVFSLTFPGRAPRGTSVRAIARDVLGGWMLVVFLLLMLGWATRTVGSLDEEVMVAWVAATPVALVAAHLLTPVLMPRLLAAEGLQRVAVIAGASSLGRRLAEKIAATPYVGVKVAGHFDDRATARLAGTEGNDLLGPVDQLAEYRGLEVPLDSMQGTGPGRRAGEARRPARNPLRGIPAPHLARRPAAVHQRAAGPHERGRPTPARRRAQRALPQAHQELHDPP